MTDPSHRDVSSWTTGLQSASFSFTGTFESDLAMPLASPLPMRYMAPRRRRLRWEVVEYSGMVEPTDTTVSPDGDFTLRSKE